MMQHIAETCHSTLKQLVERVLGTTTVEKIYLLSAVVKEQTTTSVFAACPMQEEVLQHCFLLLVVEEKRGYLLDGLQDKLEGSSSQEPWLTTLILPAHVFQAWKSRKSVQAALSKALLLYQNDIREEQANNNQLHETSEEDLSSLYTFTKGKLSSFLAGAELFLLRKEYTASAFMLHGAAEHTLSFLFYQHTGLRLQTHNLDKLLRCCTLFSCEPMHILKGKGGETEALFQKLKKAYIEARYNRDYHLLGKEAEALLQKIKTLQHYFLSITTNC